MSRKTFEVKELRDMVNNQLRKATNTPAERMATCNVLENVLHESGNYNGFAYLCADEVPKGELPGIIFDSGDTHEHKFPDESRRVYF